MATVDPIPWPITLLTFFAEHGTWQESVEPNVVDFAVEVGPSKRRRRTYLPSTRVEFQRIISSDDLNAFLDFYEGDLQSGVLNFSAVDPRTGNATEYQFMQVPSWRDVSPGYWRLQFSLRRVNLPPSQALMLEDSSGTALILEG
jgi:hypothetical protein